MSRLFSCRSFLLRVSAAGVDSACRTKRWRMASRIERGLVRVDQGNKGQDGVSREGVRLVQAFDGSLRVSCGTRANQEDGDAKQWSHLVASVSTGTWRGSIQAHLMVSNASNASVLSPSTRSKRRQFTYLELVTRLN